MNFEENDLVFWVYQGRVCKGWFIEMIDSKTALVRIEGTKGFGGEEVPLEMLNHAR